MGLAVNKQSIQKLNWGKMAQNERWLPIPNAVYLVSMGEKIEKEMTSVNTENSKI